MQTDYALKAIETSLLWDAAIDAKTAVMGFPRSADADYHQTLLDRLHSAEADLTAATGLDLETLREVLDWVVGMPYDPQEWADVWEAVEGLDL